MNYDNDTYAVFLKNCSENDNMVGFCDMARGLDEALTEAVTLGMLCYDVDGKVIPEETMQDFRKARSAFYRAYGEVLDSMVDDGQLPHMLTGAMLHYAQCCMYVAEDWGGGAMLEPFALMLPLVRDFDFDEGTDWDCRVAVQEHGLSYVGLAARIGVDSVHIMHDI